MEKIEKCFQHTREPEKKPDLIMKTKYNQNKDRNSKGVRLKGHQNTTFNYRRKNT